jgi:hypothetical protein
MFQGDLRDQAINRTAYRHPLSPAVFIYFRSAPICIDIIQGVIKPLRYEVIHQRAQAFRRIRPLEYLLVNNARDAEGIIAI